MRGSWPGQASQRRCRTGHRRYGTRSRRSTNPGFVADRPVNVADGQAVVLGDLGNLGAILDLLPQHLGADAVNGWASEPDVWSYSHGGFAIVREPSHRRVVLPLQALYESLCRASQYQLSAHLRHGAELRGQPSFRLGTLHDDQLSLVCERPEVRERVGHAVLLT